MLHASIPKAQCKQLSTLALNPRLMIACCCALLLLCIIGTPLFVMAVPVCLLTSLALNVYRYLWTKVYACDLCPLNLNILTCLFDLVEFLWTCLTPAGPSFLQSALFSKLLLNVLQTEIVWCLSVPTWAWEFLEAVLHDWIQSGYIFSVRSGSLQKHTHSS